jgi:putative addiction module component (TIGR02574 family)
MDEIPGDILAALKIVAVGMVMPFAALGLTAKLLWDWWHDRSGARSARDAPRGERTNMPRDQAELLYEALLLPIEARAALADSLLDSLDIEVDANVEEAWRHEIWRRLHEIDSGAVTHIPWQNAQHRLRVRLQA